MIRRHSNNPFTSPVLVGALTVLVMIVACVLAFEANNSLPFVPKYTLHIQVRNAEELVHGSEIHMGGALIGTVKSVTPGRLKNGKPVAIVNASIDKDVEPLPVNTRFVIRLKSTIGEKYLAVLKGNSSKTWRNGATVPVKHSTALVDLDQVLGMFNPKTRKGVQESTNGFGQALAGRGVDLNRAIGAFSPLVRALTPVMHNLASPKTNLKGFLTGLNGFTAAIAPVAAQEGHLWVALDTTFKALAGVSAPYLKQWIDQTPPTFEAVINDAPTIDPLLQKTATILADLKPGLQTLPTGSPAFEAAVSAGLKTLPSTAHFDRQLVSLAGSIDRFGKDQTVKSGLHRLQTTGKAMLKPLRFLTPAQTVCNYPTLAIRNLASSLSDNVGTGTVFRVLIVAITNGLTNGEAGPSSAPYTSTKTSSLGTTYGPLHVDPYPNTAAPGEKYECSAGNEHYSPASALIGNPPGNLGTGTEKTSGG